MILKSSLDCGFKEWLSWAQCPGGCISSCSRGNYIALLFSISFLIFWNSINLTYVLQLGNKDLVSDHIFTSQRESHSVPGMRFLLVFIYFVPFGVLERTDLSKSISNILMEIVTIPVALVDEFCFYMHHRLKVWLFEKIFELVYLFHIVLKSLIFY